MPWPNIGRSNKSASNTPPTMVIIKIDPTIQSVVPIDDKKDDDVRNDA